MRNIILITLMLLSITLTAQDPKPRLFNGSIWIEFDSNAEFMSYIDSINIASGNSAKVVFAINQSKREQVGRELVNDLFKKLQEQNLTQAEEAQIVNKISTCMVALLAGSINGARVICNALTTDAVFTPQRKAYLLGKIDAAIADL